ncbi:hypothetical protein BN59_00264 [Legionella massiliensis]|uniref:DUF7939 domain-containing protein n=1 Tax=Legionella massiliensis TaxID=1034943 RepID=A0A078KNS6_9GAMM|nr:BatD family protein [Legionella massiliensis]CDZ76000.1 hypothetical protein BN59_00264 [Legionella massiliensis]CEE11738.1 hypothetical protein BN1094_00264 [Legionella massiliensis]
MKRFILGLILLCCYGLAFAEVSLRVDKPQVQLGQPFTLTLTIEGSQINAAPDLMPLQKDFSIDSSESNINYSIVNGQVRSISEWTLVMTAKRTGLLSIPSIQVGNEKTAPLTIEVTDEAPAATTPTPQSQQNPAQPRVMQQQQQQDIMLTTDVSNPSPYVNQQIIYTVRLFNSSRLLDANYQPPEVEDALFVPMGTGRRYQVTENGRMYAVEEQQFAVFPQKTGYLKIKPPSFNALIYDFSPKRISVEAQPTTLNVKPIPPQFKGKNWLPAKQVTLSESYDKSTATLMEGSTLVRTVVLQAAAVPAQLLPTLDFANSDQFSVYPEQPVTNNQFRQQDLVGTSTVKVTYLFNKSGKVTIPTLSLAWFNTSTGKEEISSLPGFAIDVTAAAGTGKVNKTPAPVVQTAAPSQSKPPSQKKSPANNPSPQVKPQSALAWWVAGVFALAWLLTVVAWRWQRVGQTQPGQSKAQIMKELSLACANNQPKEARNALLKWGQLQWPDETLLNLFDLEQLAGESALKEQINHLAHGLYQGGSKDAWQGSDLWQAVADFKPSAGTTEEKANPLPPLHRI